MPMLAFVVLTESLSEVMSTSRIAGKPKEEEEEAGGEEEEDQGGS